MQDCVVLSISPPEGLKGPISDLRMVIPVRIVTDPWNNDGAATYVFNTSPSGSTEFASEQQGLAYPAAQQDAGVLSP